MKSKLFYNSLIRYVLLSSLKTNLVAMVALKRASGDDPLSIVLASLLSIFIMAFPLYLARILYVNDEDLNDEDNIKSFGTLYEGKDVDRENHHVWLYPIIFLYRRVIFMAATVFLIDWPSMQMIVHQLLTLASIAYVSYNGKMFLSKTQQYVEISSEVILLITSALLQQVMYDHNEWGNEMIEDWYLTFVGLLISVNIAFLIYSIVTNYKDGKRAKAIAAAKEAWELAAIEYAKHRQFELANQES